MEIEKTISNTAYISKSLDLLSKILKSGCCNNCANIKTCKYAPADGELPRYNCPHYRIKIKDMSIKDKIKSAKTDGWLAEGLTDEEIKEAIRSAKAEKEIFSHMDNNSLYEIIITSHKQRGGLYG